MSGTRLFVYSLSWSFGTAAYGLATHDSGIAIFRSAWDVTGFALVVAFIMNMEARS